ncbi:GNAT family N-acetyltransferase [Aestuariirhabdus litorea]|uniref:GNAT family N-acetyltransferase n=1 Tax=Aestuariirhabdus litorea TaxID=2528527 RepID=A0A3P3VMY9_9GAMM|nr:GNAT family N-acetyltransferase [Aestuariirhabdus litorea]RRJ83069.1 GNAT family N-acetyltransferase [Aestuariirhabdus litorea]RWW93227.1 GNAT family N-acetyltransferase [Endozoicomonadaceae bacterium GTF-13]
MIRIRPAVEADVDTILRFIVELARYEKAEHEVKTDAEGIRRSLFAEGSPASALICERDGRAIGYAVYFYNYSTWLGRKGLYLEDLYITPEERGGGAGKGLLQQLARMAVEQGCGRFEWSVLDWNEPAIGFYKSLGAEPQDEWVIYRLTGEALKRFAAG